jgi:hypothetical protein
MAWSSLRCVQVDGEGKACIHVRKHAAVGEPRSKHTLEIHAVVGFNRVKNRLGKDTVLQDIVVA